MPDPVSNKLAARISGSSSEKCCCTTVVLECKSRTATAQLVGFWPINGDWSDMRRWRRSTLSGEITGQEADLWHGCIGDASVPFTPDARDKTCTPVYCRLGTIGSSYLFVTSDKVGQYDRVTGAYSQTGSTYYRNPGSTPITDTYWPNTYHSLRCPMGLSGSTIGSNLEFSPDSVTVATTPECFRYAQGTYWNHLGGLRAEHSDQDSDGDAEARVTATWSAWGCAGSETCCTSFRGEKRITNHETRPVIWNMRAVKFRLGVPDGVRGTFYDVDVEYHRRPIGSSAAFTLVTTETFSVVADPDPTTWVEHDLDQVAGYETKVMNARFNAQS